MVDCNSLVFVNRVYPPDHTSTGQLLADMAEALIKQDWQVTDVVSHTASLQRETVSGVRIVHLRGLSFTQAIRALVFRIPMRPLLCRLFTTGFNRISQPPC